MSRAFVSESDTDNEPDLPPLKIPLPPGARNYMTPAGAEKLQKEISNLRQNDRSKLSARVTTLISSAKNAASSELRTAQQDLAVLDRQLNYLEELMRTAEVVTRPPGPVQTLEFPALTTIARTVPYPRGNNPRVRRTGAPTTWFRVMTIAAVASESAAKIATSSLPPALIPHATPAAVNPAGSVICRVFIMGRRLLIVDEE